MPTLFFRSRLQDVLVACMGGWLNGDWYRGNLEVPKTESAEVVADLRRKWLLLLAGCCFNDNMVATT